MALTFMYSFYNYFFLFCNVHPADTDPILLSAFSLGMKHDDLSINSCDPADNNVMTAILDSSDAKFLNLYSFSSCSVDYLTTYVNDINRQVCAIH